MANGKPLTVVLPGHQKRNFTHIDDIIEGIILVGKYGHGDEFGIGSSQSYSILEIANMFGGEIIMIPKRKGKRMEGEVISNKTIELGWTAKNKISEYIGNLKDNNWKY